MANFNIDSVQDRTYDAIVIGSGIAGGWSAKELCERGLKTLVLERGRDVKHNVDYPTTSMMPWEFKHRGEIPHEIQQANPVVSKCYAFREDAMHFFVKDNEHPYVRKNRSIGFVATRLAENLCYGRDKRNGGVSSIFKVQPVMVLLWIGLFDTKTLLRGTVMLKNLRVLLEIKTVFLRYRMASFCQVSN